MGDAREPEVIGDEFDEEDDTDVPQGIFILLAVFIAVCLLIFIILLAVYLKKHHMKNPPKKSKNKFEGAPATFGPFQLIERKGEGTNEPTRRVPVNPRSRPTSQEITVKSSSVQPMPKRGPQPGGERKNPPRLVQARTTIPATNSDSYQRPDGFTVFTAKSDGDSATMGSGQGCVVPVVPTKANIYYNDVPQTQAENPYYNDAVKAKPTDRDYQNVSSFRVSQYM